MTPSELFLGVLGTYGLFLGLIFTSTRIYRWVGWLAGQS